jgi:hypothetical protein
MVYVSSNRMLTRTTRRFIRCCLAWGSVETVSVRATADHRHRYKLTGVTRYVCVSGPVRRMSLSPHVTYYVTHVTMISHPSDDQWLRSRCIAVTVTLCTLYIYAPCNMRLI